MLGTARRFPSKPPFKTAALLLAAAAALGAAPPALAQDMDDLGPYVLVAGGKTQYHYDCYFMSDCGRGHANFAKLGLGWRYGVFALEGWAADFGRSDIQYGNTLRLRAAGINGAWHLHFTDHVQGFLRAGFANVQLRRSDDAGTSNWEGNFGLGALFQLAPRLYVELAWDATSAEGSNTGSALAQGLSLGLRVRF